MPAETVPTNSPQGEGLQLETLKHLAGASGPCITVYVPREHGKNTAGVETARLKAATNDVESQLSNKLNSQDLAALLEPLRSLAVDLQPQNGTREHTLVIFRSPEHFLVHELHGHFEQASYAGDYFHVLPSIKEASNTDAVFYLLSLSQKHVRLLRCTADGLEAVDWPASAPTSVEQWLGTRLPTDSPDKNVGEFGGSFTSTTDRDNQNQHLVHFYNAVNKAVNEVLHDSTSTLVLAGVEYELAMYRGVNTYQHLAEDAVHGAPDGLPGHELLDRALAAIEEHTTKKLNAALVQYEKNGGSGRAISDERDILKASQEARVSHLFVSQDFVQPTSVEDPSNVAALQTIAFGGRVYFVSPELLPGDGPIAAVLRY